jgi:hypothetical protein
MADFEKTLSHFRIQKRTGNHIQAFCPVHEDKNASLSITINADKMLLYCHAGCYISDILNKSNLEFGDLFPDKAPVGLYQYRYEDNELAYEKVKYKTADGKTFRQRRLDNDQIVSNLDGIRRVPYNYPTVLAAVKSESPILFVEGEKDADTGRLLGFASTTMGGASDWKDEYKGFFKNANVILIPDKDDPGMKASANIQKSLVTVCKSVKVVILPNGKDLTEWVEAGNSDLHALMKETTELVTYKGISDPIVIKTITGYDFTWKDLNILIKIERLTDDAEAIIVIKDLNNNRILHTSKINLLATRSLTELANRLNKSKQISWETMLSIIANRCFDSLTDGGETVNIDQEPKNMNIEYLLEPLIPIGEPVTIFAAGGKGKSIFADYIAVLIQHGYAAQNDLPIFPQKVNVMYLDWEADAEIHRRYITAIKRGLNITDSTYIAYRRLDYPLAQINDNIRAEISKLNIGFVIIDSQMAATASGRPGLTEAQVASEYYNIIRSWGIATLTIDHITKTGMKDSDDNVAPYGTIVKYNRSRSQFELRLDEGDDDDHKEYALIHKKFNLGRKLKPMGFSVDFSNNGHGLEEITFKAISLAENPTLNKTMTKTDRVIAAIKHFKGQAAAKDIAEYLGSDTDEDIKSITSILANKKKYFIQLSRGLYGLVSNVE